MMEVGIKHKIFNLECVYTECGVLKPNFSVVISDCSVKYIPYVHFEEECLL